jgi:hypothetical protein
MPDGWPSWLLMSTSSLATHMLVSGDSEPSSPYLTSAPGVLTPVFSHHANIHGPHASAFFQTTSSSSGITTTTGYPNRPQRVFLRVVR